MPQQLQVENAEYSREERTQLLRLAHESIRSHLAGRKLSPGSPSPHLAERRGAFTTLHLDGHLRGCIGYILAASPLYETVIETAVAAAIEDPRFMPVTSQEASRLQTGFADCGGHALRAQLPKNLGGRKVWPSAFLSSSVATTSPNP